MPRLEVGDILSLLLVAAVLVAGVSIILSTLRLGTPPVPTSPRVLREVLRLVPPEQQGTVLELGSGWGTLAFALADHCPRARVVAYELSPVPYAFSWLRQRLAPRPNLLLVRQDFFQASLSGASLVVGYLVPAVMTRLKPKLTQELAPGSLILTHTFALRGWKPRESRVVDDLYRTHVYLYSVQ
jgi:16S rRNA A1518/A1519 N6-dimethyltransferase RsmA/KsgA/DIM1 with predicted DNA glycosylase/AP lyase activity